MTFADAVKKVRTLSAAPDAATLLKLYGLYKQGSEGDVAGDRPGALDLRGRAKHDAWKALQGLAPEEAQRQYIGLVDALLARDAERASPRP